MFSRVVHVRMIDEHGGSRIDGFHATSEFPPENILGGEQRRGKVAFGERQSCNTFLGGKRLTFRDIIE
jgi:hypothetical protein